MRFTGLAVLTLCSSFAVSPAFAWDFPKNDSQAKSIYKALQRDYNRNPYFKNENLNLFRDKKRSRYLASSDPFMEQADPLTDTEIKNLPDGTFPSWTLFNRAITGMRLILSTLPSLDIRPETLTIIDFDQKTEGRRFTVVDLEQEKVVFQTWVHHGKNSDTNKDRLPESFSNVNDSNQSSLGFYLTEMNSYEGLWGHSVRMHGLDRNLNSNIHDRAIVMHPWLPLHARRVAAFDPTQTSLGCLALPYYESGKFQGLSDDPMSLLIVDHLKGHSVIYVNSSKLDLVKNSNWLNGKMTAATAKATLSQVMSDEGRSPLIDEALAYPANPPRY